MAIAVAGRVYSARIRGPKMMYSVVIAGVPLFALYSNIALDRSEEQFGHR